MLKGFSLTVRRTKRRWLYGLMSVITALSITIATPSPTYAFSWLDMLFRGVQIFQISNLSDRQEVELGKQINRQLVQGRQMQIHNNRQINEYVNEIGQRLVPYSNRTNIPYTFQVVRDNNINAFATMGGYTYVTTGLMKAADNEAQLASVIAHEIAHITERHAVKQMRQRALAAGVLSAAGLDQSAAVRIGVELALQRPNSRGDELEADAKALETFTAAGYAPIAIVNFMEKLRGRSNVPEFLSTHPATSERVQRLNAAIDPAVANVGDGLNATDYRARIRPLL